MTPRQDDGTPWSRMLHQAQRAVDHQIRALEELDDKIEHMMTIAGTGVALGIGFAALGIQGGSPSPSPWFPRFLAAAVALDVLAILVLYGAYAGFVRRYELHVGPNPAAWLAKVHDAGFRENAFFRGMLSSLAKYFQFNSRTLARKLRRRDLGVAFLFVSILPYVAALFFIGG